MTTSEPRELDRRNSDGVDVSLLWDAVRDRVSIALLDERSGDSMAFDVDPADALDAFQHPFVYAPINRSRSRAVA